MRTYSPSNELTFSSINVEKNNDLNPVFHQNCKIFFSFTGIYRGHGREKLEHYVVFEMYSLPVNPVGTRRRFNVEAWLKFRREVGSTLIQR